MKMPYPSAYNRAVPAELAQHVHLAAVHPGPPEACCPCPQVRAQPAFAPGRGLSSAWQPGRPRVWVPATDGSPPRPPGGRSRPASLFGLRVLLVDDSRETLEAFSALLALEGAEVHVAGDGLAALRLCEQQEFDLILSDIGMPDMDGYALIEELRRRPATRHVTAFALSGFGDRGGIERALACGFQAYLAKPVTLEALREAMFRYVPAGLADEQET